MLLSWLCSRRGSLSCATYPSAEPELDLRDLHLLICLQVVGDDLDHEEQLLRGEVPRCNTGHNLQQTENQNYTLSNKQ